MSDITAAVCDLDRLQAITGFDIFHPDKRIRLDDICRSAAETLHHPMAMVSIVLSTAQFHAGSHGLTGWILDAQGTPVEWAFCPEVVARRAPYVVTDATLQPRHRTSPLVVHEGLRSYAGVPVTAPGGQVMGALCVADHVPWEHTGRDIAWLEGRAEEVVAALGA